MNPGILDTLVLVESLAVTPGDMGDAVESWIPVSSPWATMKNLVGRELIEAQQRVAETDTKFTVRYSSTTSNISTKCRIIVPKFETVYDILEALPMPGGRPDRIEILAKRRAD